MLGRALTTVALALLAGFSAFFLILDRRFLLLFEVVEKGESRLPFELEKILPAGCGGRARSLVAAAVV